MLDIALLTANASQLKYVLQVGEDKHPFYTLMLVLIITSIILQVSPFLKKNVVSFHFGNGKVNVDPNSNLSCLVAKWAWDD